MKYSQKLLDIMESRTVRDDFLAQAGAMVRAQRALKVDYGVDMEPPRQTREPQDAA
jgi:hypothetical protein